MPWSSWRGAQREIGADKSALWQPGTRDRATPGADEALPNWRITLVAVQCQGRCSHELRAAVAQGDIG